MKYLFPTRIDFGSLILQLYNQRSLWMKVNITFFLSIFLGLNFLVAHDGYGQGLKEEMVTIGVQGQYLSNVLQEIEQKIDYRFAYNDKQIAGYLVDLEYGERNLEETLNLILAGKPLMYEVVKDKFIVLSLVERRSDLGVVRPLNSLKLETNVLKVVLLNVSGIVTDDAGNALIGVNVQVQGTNKGTITDFDGRYEINDINENAVLVFSYIGYQTQEIMVNGETTINLVMLTDAQMMDEVVVTALGIKREVRSLM